MEEEVAELLDRFENLSLTWLRAADEKDVNVIKISRLVGQAYSIEKLLTDVEDYEGMCCHDQIFPNKSHLPTFNSNAIELHLHNIEGNHYINFRNSDGI